MSPYIKLFVSTDAHYAMNQPALPATGGILTVFNSIHIQQATTRFTKPAAVFSLAAPNSNCDQ